MTWLWSSISKSLIINGLDNQAQHSVWISKALIIKPKNPIIKSIKTHKKAWYVSLLQPMDLWTYSGGHPASGPTTYTPTLLAWSNATTDWEKRVLGFWFLNFFFENYASLNSLYHVPFHNVQTHHVLKTLQTFSARDVFVRREGGRERIKNRLNQYNGWFPEEHGNWYCWVATLQRRIVLFVSAPLFNSGAHGAWARSHISTKLKSGRSRSRMVQRAVNGAWARSHISTQKCRCITMESTLSKNCKWFNMARFPPLAVGHLFTSPPLALAVALLLRNWDSTQISGFVMAGTHHSQPHLYLWLF